MDSPELSNELLAEKLIEYFSSQKDFSLEFEEVPLTGDIVLNLRFGEWHATVSYEEDEVVKEDSLEIQNRTANFKVHDVSNIDRRVRIIFGNDDKREYTNETPFLFRALTPNKSFEISMKYTAELEKFDHFLMIMDDQLESLERLANGFGINISRDADSFEKLELLFDMVTEGIDSDAKSEFLVTFGRYLGEIVCETYGGHWTL
eukprot:gene32514-55005_t